MLDMLVETAVE